MGLVQLFIQFNQFLSEQDLQTENREHWDELFRDFLISAREYYDTHKWQPSPSERDSNERF